jgi:hypothetical protein
LGRYAIFVSRPNEGKPFYIDFGPIGKLIGLDDSNDVTINKLQNTGFFITDHTYGGHNPYGGYATKSHTGKDVGAVFLNTHTIKINDQTYIKNIFVHELRHALDEYKSRVIRPKHYHTQLTPDDLWSSPLEINALLTQSLYHMKTIVGNKKTLSSEQIKNVIHMGLADRYAGIYDKLKKITKKKTWAGISKSPVYRRLFSRSYRYVEDLLAKNNRST